MLRSIIICAVLFLSTTTYAADLEALIVAPSEPVQAGSEVEIEVYFINPADHMLQADIHGPLRGHLIGGKRIFEVTLIPSSAGSLTVVDVPAKGFFKRRYRFNVPESLEDHVGIALQEFSSKRVLFMVRTAGQSPEKAGTEGGSGRDGLENIHALFQPDTPHIPDYEPTYFSVGTDPEKTKFQFSFKYKIFGTRGVWALRNPWLTGFHFGYTQTSLWDLQGESKPFEDTSYKPELFYVTPNLDPGLPRVSFFCIQTGLQHESNGKGGENSRSTNYLYAKPIFAVNLFSGYYLKVAPKLWVYVDNDEETNPDIEAYRGYIDLELKLGQSDSFVVSTNLRYGNKGGSIQGDFTYPLYMAVQKILFLDEDPGWINPNLYLHSQYFNGYSESLLDYNRKSHALRLGIALVR